MRKRPSEIIPGSRAPGYEHAPKHKVAFVPRFTRVTVRAGDLAIADTTDVVALEEDGYPVRYYLARDGVDMSRLEKTDQVTYCPFKGLATYYTIRSEDGETREAVWSYEQTYSEAEPLKDRLAFDPTKVQQVAEIDS